MQTKFLTIKYCFLCILFLISCKKVEISSAPGINNSESAGLTHLTNYNILNNYTRILTLATLDLTADEDFISISENIAEQHSSLSDTSDYYAYFDSIALRYNNDQRSLISLMSQSIVNNGGSTGDVELFNDSGFVMQLGNYTYHFRLFFHYKNENEYGQVSNDERASVGNIMFHMNNDGTFPVYTFINSSYSLSNKDFYYTNNNAVILISSRVYTTQNGFHEIDTKRYEEGRGRCLFTATAICDIKGKGCRCTPTDATRTFETIIGEFKSLINE